jgi:hypothetical protein
MADAFLLEPDPVGWSMSMIDCLSAGRRLQT